MASLQLAGRTEGSARVTCATRSEVALVTPTGKDTTLYLLDDTVKLCSVFKNFSFQWAWFVEGGVRAYKGPPLEALLINLAWSLEVIFLLAMAEGGADYDPFSDGGENCSAG